MTDSGQSVTPTSMLGNVLATVIKWEGGLDVDAVIRELRDRGWHLTKIAPDHPDHPSKAIARKQGAQPRDLGDNYGGSA